MDETDLVSRLIGDVYDAALDPALWPQILEKTCSYVQGISSALVSHDSLQKSAQFYASWGDDPQYTRSYFDKYAKINPSVLPATIYGKVGDVSTYLDFTPLDEYRASRFYKEWAGPQGYIDGVQATLDKSPTSYAAVVVVRHETLHGPVDEGARHRMGLLAPHFLRAVAIGKIVDLHKVEAATLADTLDGLAAAVLLVDASARIVHANVAAHRVLSERSVAQALHGKFAALDAQADRALHDIFTKAASGDGPVGNIGIAVPLIARDGQRHIAHVLPLVSGARRRAGLNYSAVAAVFLQKAALEMPHPLKVLADTYDLTPAEMRVLMLIVEIGGVPEVAPVLGVSETTVKTHLQHVFAKTGTNRQADLVKLVASHVGPFGR